MKVDYKDLDDKLYTRNVPATTFQKPTSTHKGYQTLLLRSDMILLIDQQAATNRWCKTSIRFKWKNLLTIHLYKHCRYLNQFHLWAPKESRKQSSSVSSGQKNRICQHVSRALDRELLDRHCGSVRSSIPLMKTSFHWQDSTTIPDFERIISII